MTKNAVIENEVQQRDALVVLRQQPRREAVAVVQVVQRFHKLCSCAPCGGVAEFGRLRPRGAALGWLSDSHVGDQLQQLLLADQALEGRHDRLEARHDLGLRVQDRLADVGLVGDDLAAALRARPGLP